MVRRLRGRWFVAAIRPGGKAEGTWALPKGLVGGDERPEDAAAREVEEETGLRARLVRKLGDVRYVYTQTWDPGRGQCIFKIVSFYLFRYSSGRLGDVPTALAHEVEEARWLPLEDAPSLLAYRGERDMAERALIALEEEAL